MNPWRGRVDIFMRKEGGLDGVFGIGALVAGRDGGNGVFFLGVMSILVKGSAEGLGREYTLYP